MHKRSTLVTALASVIGLVLTLAAPASAAGLFAGLQVTADQAAALKTAREKAVEYLKRAQRDDGGFNGGEVTAWVVLALAMAGEDPGGGAWQKGGVSPVRYVELNPGSLHSTTDYARLILAAAAAGKNINDFGGRDLLAGLLAGQNEEGHFGRGTEADLVNSQAWSVIALSLAGQPVPRPEKARDWLLMAQNEDGGWGVSTGSDSDPDNSAAAAIALRLLGVEPDDPPLRKVRAYFKDAQLDDGGFGYQAVVGNSGSDAMVILALAAMGQNPPAEDWNGKGKGLFGHLLSLQDSDGGFQWQPGVIANPVWMTAQALLALAALRPLPALPNFNDVPGTHYAAPAIQRLVQKGVLAGYPDGAFRPDNPVTRAEFAKIVVYALGLRGEASRSTERFVDLPEAHWANGFIRLALERGLMRGKGEGRFDPEGWIAGAEVMAVLARAGGLAAATAEKQGSDWYTAYLELAKKEGWLYPDFQPHAPATRAQVAYSVASGLKH